MDYYRFSGHLSSSWTVFLVDQIDLTCRVHDSIEPRLATLNWTTPNMEVATVRFIGPMLRATQYPDMSEGTIGTAILGHFNQHLAVGIRIADLCWHLSAPDL